MYFSQRPRATPTLRIDSAHRHSVLTALHFFFKIVSRRNSSNPAIWLVPWARGFLRSCPLTRAEFLCDELCNGFFKHVKVYILTYRHKLRRKRVLSSRWGDMKKIKNIGAIGNEENQQNVDVLTMANVQSYILAQRVEDSWKTHYDLNVWMRLFRRISVV